MPFFLHKWLNLIQQITTDSYQGGIHETETDL